MSKKIFNQVIAFTFIAIMLSNDVLASVNAYIFYKNNGFEAPSELVEEETTEPTDFTSNKEVTNPNQPLENNTPEGKLSVPTEEPAPIEELIPIGKETTERGTLFGSSNPLGFLGTHPSDQMNNPTDNIFPVVIDEEIEGNYKYAYLEYQVKGLENGTDIPKSINGASVYTGAVLERAAKDEWQTVTSRINTTELIKGRNIVRFAVPNRFDASVEVQEVKVRLSNTVEEVKELTKIYRQKANPENFKILSETEITYPIVLAYELSDVDMPSVPHNINNVTKSANGYRITADENEVYKISISVDAARLLSKSKLREVQIFYFDNTDFKWKATATENVDEQGLKIEATVPGNTDYFAGMISSPEMPEASAYLPTTISDIQAANPAAEMNIMQPPSISHTGEASLYYPLTIPQGRQGMTPKLGLSYSSDKGTGWLGMGWNIATPSIDIDTRWGVPRFEADQDETYVLNGTSLTMEGEAKGNRGSIDGGVIQTVARKSGTVYFFEPTMSSYKEIIREGNDPSNYVWKEVTADQTTFYYGTTDGTNPSSNHVIAKSGGDIVKWALAKVEDKWGNTITYTYDKDDNTTGLPNNFRKGGVTLVLSKIQYTGHGTSLGKYTIDFISSDNRQDGTISYKTGMKTMDDRRLDEIIVEYDNTEVYRYKLHYDQEGDFFKTILTSIEEFRGDPAVSFYEHTFEYYSGSINFNPIHDVIIDNIHHTTNPFTEGFPDLMTFLEYFVDMPKSLAKTTTTTGYGYGGSVGIGYAPKLSAAQNKNFTFSGVLGHSKTDTYDKISLNDVNGDGTPDVLYHKSRKGRRYYPIQKNDDGTLSKGNLTKIKRDGPLYKSSGSTFKYGFDFAAVLAGVNFTYGRNWNMSKSKTDTYLTDYNADGILDIVLPNGNGSIVRFGVLNKYGELDFEETSKNTHNPVFKGATPPALDDDDDDTKDFEIIRTWEAPFDGEVEIDGTAIIPSAQANGEIKVGIQHNSSWVDSPIDISPGQNDQLNYTIEVEKGDLLLFRAYSIADGFDDLLIWNPSVEYTSLTRVDANGIDYTNSTYEDGFLLSGGSGVEFDGDEQILIELNQPNLINSLTDDVVLKIIVDVTNSSGVPQQPIIWEKVISAGVNGSGIDFLKSGSSTQPDFIDGQLALIPSINSSDRCNLRFEIFSTSNVDWKEMEWRPIVKFSDDCEQADRITYPTVYYNTYNRLETLNSTLPSLSILTYSGTDEITFTPTFNTITNADYESIFTTAELVASPGTVITREAYMVVKNDGNPLAKLAISFKNDYTYSVVDVDPNGDIYTTLGVTNKFLGSDVSGSTEDIYIEFFAPYQQINDIINNRIAAIQVENITQSIAEEYTTYNIFYSDRTVLQDYSLHWGQFAWSNLDPQTAFSLINTSTDLVLGNDNFASQQDLSEANINTQTISENMQTYSETLNPLNQKFFSLIPYRGEITNGLRNYIRTYNTDNEIDTEKEDYESLDRWTAFSSYIASYALGGVTAPGKYGEIEDEESTEPQVTHTNYSAYGISIKSKSFSLGETGGVSASISPIGASLHGSETINDRNTYYSQQLSSFQDINGDGYPEIIRYDNASGAVKASTTLPTGAYRTTEKQYISTLLSKEISKREGLTLGGKYINDDNRFNTVGLSGSLLSTGDEYSISQLIDINGDGIPERIHEYGGNYFANLSNGYFFNPSTPIDSDVKSIVDSDTYPSNLTGTIGDLNNDWTTNSFSYSVGMGVNKVHSDAQSMFVDLNGDNLKDWIIIDEYIDDLGNVSSTNPDLDEDGRRIKVYLNRGTTFKEYTDATFIEIVDGILHNKNTGFNLSTAGTVGIPIPLPTGGAIKISISGNVEANYAINRLVSSFIDMNGDGAPDLVETPRSGELRVYYSKVGKSNKLKTVTNPLGGSFTIDYELIGNKYGFYPTKVKVNDENNDNGDNHMLWDMPYSKWVMSRLETNDGVLTSSNIDGFDWGMYFFNYDGGIKSRRERDFYGFTRIEKKYLPNKTDNPGSIDHDDYTQFMEPYETDFEYITEVKEFERPRENTPSYFKRFYYMHNQVINQYTLYNKIEKETIGSGEEAYDIFHHTIKPMNIEQYDYEYRGVNLTSEMGAGLNTVEKINSDWNVVSNNWRQVPETKSIFPALIATTSYAYPQVKDPNVDEKAYVTKNAIEYDKYFNVTRYSNEGELVKLIIDSVVTDTIIRDTCHYITKSTVLVDENDPISPNPDLSTDDTKCYIITEPDYSTDTVCVTIPNYSCRGTLEDYVIVSQHKKCWADTIYIYEKVDNSVYTGKVIADMTYYDPVSADYQTNVLKTHKIYVGSVDPANLERHTEVTSLTANELAPDEIKNYYIATSDFAETDITYNSKGNVTQIIAPANATSQRLQTDYTYDTDVEQFVVGVSNSYGDNACMTYDPATGNLLKQVGINGHATQYVYDQFYRLSEFWAPRELQNSLFSETVLFQYYPFGIDPNGSGADRVPVAITSHNVDRNEATSYSVAESCTTVVDLSTRYALVNYMQTATFIDGMGKTIQVKKDVSDGTDRSRLITGFTYYDHLLRPLHTSRVEKELITDPIGRLNTNKSNILINRNNTYDYANRPLSSEAVSNIVWLPSSNRKYTTTEYEYSWKEQGSGEYILYTKVETGGLDVNYDFDPEYGSVQYIDSWGRTIKSTMLGYGTLTDATTYFEYDALNQLLKSTNAKGVETDYTYDNFGRLVTEDHDDRGLTTMEYDMVGNVIALNTPATGSNDITFEYDYNRLTRKIVPNTGDVYNVQFTYGSKADGYNGAGRIIKVEQGFDPLDDPITPFRTVDYVYDEIGNVVNEDCDLVLPVHGTKSYTTEYEYDSWGRILNMVYPDGEEVTYEYKTKTADLERILAQKTYETNPYVIVDNIEYDGFENMSLLEYGNLASTSFTYDQQTFSLEDVTVNTFVNTTSTRKDIIDKTFDYDIVGRITTITNDVDNGLNADIGMGGNYKYEHTYDYFGRLATTDAYFDKIADIDGSTATDFTLNMGYNSVGGITTKTQVVPSSGDADDNLDYDFGYAYSSSKPHQIDKITNNLSSPAIKEMVFTYNSSGSVTAIDHNATTSASSPTDTERFIWNEEQQLMGSGTHNTTNNQINTHYVYNEVGERIMKGNLTTVSTATDGQGGALSLSVSPYTIYVNPYYVVEHYSSSNHVSTHYFIGSQRVASTVGRIDLTTQGEKTANNIPLEEMGVVKNLQYILEQVDIKEGEDYELDELYSVGEYEDYYPSLGNASSDFTEDDTQVDDVPLDQYARIVYWYHPDYIGNTEYITDMDGVPYQYFWYSSFGETMITDEAGVDFSALYRFNGKELDDETGLYYYGARYYNPAVSVWLSVDPLAHRSPNQTPYHFVSNNPIMLIDPDGRDDGPVFGSDGSHRGDTKEGYTGQVIIYDGCDDFSNMSESELLASGASTYDNADLPACAKSMIITHISNAKLNDGLNQNRTISVTYDPNSKTFYSHERTNKSTSYITAGIGNENGRVYDSNQLTYETTVENVRNSVLLHEVYGHGISDISGYNKDHYKAYELQISNPQFLTTTKEYQANILAKSWDYFYKAGKGGYFIEKYGDLFYNRGGYTEAKKQSDYYNNYEK